MKKIIIILLFAISSNLAFAHKAAMSAAFSRKEKRSAEMEKQFEMNKLMLDNRDFVLEADYLQDQWGDRVYVNSMINYLAVDSTTAVIQTGSNYRLGRNGVGGITAKGRITGWKLSENKKEKTYSLFFIVTTNIGVYDLQFMIGPSDYSTARLTGIRAGQLTFAGNLVPYNESSVFEGQSF